MWPIYFARIILYICTTKVFIMTQKVTLLLKSENIRFAKKSAKKSGRSMSKMVDEYLDLLQKIDKKMSEEELDPFVKRFGGMVSTGKNVNIKSFF